MAEFTLIGPTFWGQVVTEAVAANELGLRLLGFPAKVLESDQVNSSVNKNNRSNRCIA